MIPQAVEAVVSSPGASPTPWVGGQLPSPWITPNAQPTPPSAPNSFAQSLEQARSVVGTGAAGSMASNPTPMSAAPSQDGGVAKKVGFSSIETLGTRLSQADAKMYNSVESLNNLDPTSPNLQAELLSVSLMSTKAGISTTLAMKFSSKVNESINTLLKTS